MGRKGGDVGARLQAAALELFGKRGYDRTTAADIAARAGVTERTFFRYFPDKREVLFNNEAMVRATLIASIAAAPNHLDALDTLFTAFKSFQSLLEDSGSYLKPRHDIIAATSALHERELAKIDSLAEALADALEARGASALRSALAARVGMAAFVHATRSWLENPSVGFDWHLDLAAQELRALLAEFA